MLSYLTQTKNYNNSSTSKIIILSSTGKYHTLYINKLENIYKNKSFFFNKNTIYFNRNIKKKNQTIYHA